jgi:hypothetical protein
MSSTLAGPVARLQSVLAEQVHGYRRLREANRAGARVPRRRDADAHDATLAEQVATLRELAELRRERREALQALAPGDSRWPSKG